MSDKTLDVRGCNECPVAYCDEDGATFCAYSSRVNLCLNYDEGRLLHAPSDESPEMIWPAPPPAWCPLREGSLTLRIDDESAPGAKP